MGPGEVVEEVTQAGGICRYDPAQPLPQSRVGFAQANFVWLKDVLCAAPPSVDVWVGLGDRDQKSRELLRDAVPPGHYLVLPGGHDWDVWRPALEHITQNVFGPSGSASTQ
jgi:enterochelin esterase-like enzyme